MAYTAHVWGRGDIITADLLNRIENGVEDNSDKVTRLDESSSSLSNRIDNLIFNSGDSDVDVLDAHTGIDGTVYQTLKARLDAEIGSINSSMLSDMVATISQDTVDGVVSYTCNKTYEEIRAYKGKVYFKLGTKLVLMTEIDSNYVGATFYGNPAIDNGIMVFRVILKSDDTCKVVVRDHLVWSDFVKGGE